MRVLYVACSESHAVYHRCKAEQSEELQQPDEQVEEIQYCDTSHHEDEKYKHLERYTEYIEVTTNIIAE